MYFGTKSYLKSTRNHTAKHALKDHTQRKKKSNFFHIPVKVKKKIMNAKDYLLRITYKNM
jgi:hypothetical protein